MASILSSLAVTYPIEKKSSDAGPLMDRAISIWDKELGEGHEERVEQRKNVKVYLNNLGVLCLNHKENEAAERMFTEAIKLDPRYILAYANRSITRRLLGNATGADADHEAVKRLKSDTEKRSGDKNEETKSLGSGRQATARYSPYLMYDTSSSNTSGDSYVGDFWPERGQLLRWPR
jgi:tetratricopeptide (TPR) repeat protein